MRPHPCQTQQGNLQFLLGYYVVFGAHLDVVCSLCYQDLLLASLGSACNEYLQTNFFRTVLQPLLSTLRLVPSVTLGPVCRIQHLDLLLFMSSMILQCSKLLRSLFKASFPLRESTAPPTSVSSVKLIMVCSTAASNY